MLLLDEPFGALDAKVRKDLRKWLRDIHDRTGLTTVFVTHDQAEAMEIADRVAILNAGRIEQIGAPRRHPGAAGDRLRARLPQLSGAGHASSGPSRPDLREASAPVRAPPLNARSFRRTLEICS